MKLKVVFAFLMPLVTVLFFYFMREVKVYPVEGISVLIMAPCMLFCYFLVYKIKWVEWDGVFYDSDNYFYIHFFYFLKRFTFIMWIMYSFLMTHLFGLFALHFFENAVPHWMDFWVVLSRS